MNVNLTLVVQAANFFVAYHILVRLLLRPALAQVQGQDAQEQKLLRSIARTDRLAQRRTAENSERWAAYQQELQKAVPSQPFAAVHAQALVFEHTLAQQEKKRTAPVAIQKTVHALVEAVQHVD